MHLGSAEWLGFLVLLGLLFHLVDHPGWRQGTLAAANLLFLGTVASTPAERIALGSMVVGGYFVVWLFQTGHFRGAWALWTCIGGWVGIWVVVRGGLPAAKTLDESGTFVLVGFSYFMFKHLHLCIDASQEQLPRLRPLTYFNYMASFFTFVAGPIQRYPDFAESAAANAGQPGRRSLLHAVNRLVNGYFKAFILAAWVAEYSHPRWLSEFPDEKGVWLILPFLAFYFGYYAFLYLNFSGYTDLAIGSAGLLGIRLPENFDRPWLAQNPLEFWQRWHISLSNWLRDYVFTPVYHTLRTRLPILGLVGAAFAYFVTFGIAGLWHGPTPNYVLFGLMHGAAAVVHTVAVSLANRWINRERLRAFRARFSVRVVSIVACNVYVALTMLVFGWPLDTLRRVVEVMAGRWGAWWTI